MSSPTHHVLNVPGASLHYDVQGSGPVLMFVGHPMGAMGFSAIATMLAEDYTVVTFDPRGFDRSTIEDSEQEARPELLADDVAQILAAVNTEPARVFGSSGGAVTGLALVARHPHLVHTLVAHEPPLALLLPDAEAASAELHDIYNTYISSGISDAWKKFSTFTGIRMARPPSESLQGAALAMGNRFFRHGFFPITFYEPDFPSLSSAASRVIAAGGTTSRDQFAQRTAVALAQHLSTPLVDFPGGHAGFITDTKDFANTLRGVLA